jgi:hypothetical protein
MSNDRILPPELNDILDDFKNEIFRDFNCIKIGAIKSYDKVTASAEVQIKIKEWTDYANDKSIGYPVIQDVPIMVLQGGGSWLEFPIAEGDPCLLLFNDRDIDNWWISGNETTPNSLRKHELSDCLAIVGINPKANALALNGKLRLFGGPHKMDFVNDNQGMADLTGQLFSNIDDLFTQITGLISDISSLVTINCVVGSPVTLNPATIAALTTRSGNFTTAKTNFDTLKTKYTQLLGS